MGTTAEKINYAINATNDIAEGINNIGGNITQNTELADFRKELDNIYNELPKVTGEGSSFNLENTRKGKVISLPEGNTSQDSTEGYNYIDTSLFKDTTKGGMSFTRNNDGSILINGTATANVSYYPPVDFTIPAGDYTIYIPYDDSFSGFTISLGYNGAIPGTICQPFKKTGSNAHLKSITFSEDTPVNKFRFYIGSGTTINNYLLKWMLIPGTYTEDDIPPYEPYTGGQSSPNPDYPQDIKVVTGKNKVKYKGINYFNHYNYPVTRVTDFGITITNNGDGSFTINGTCTQDNKGFYLGSSAIVRNLAQNNNITHTLYYVSGKNTKSSSSTVRNVLRLNYNNGASMIPLQELESSKIISKTLLQTSRTDGFDWEIILGKGDIFDNFTVKYQLNIGDTALPYEPYIQPKEFELDLTSKNRFNGSYKRYLYTNSLPESTTNNIVIDYSDSNNVKATWKSNQYLEILTEILELIPNANYTLIFDRVDSKNKGWRNYIYEKNNNSFSLLKTTYNTGKNIVNFTTGSSGKIAFGFALENNSIEEKIEIKDIMLLEGEYTEETIPVFEQYYNYELAGIDEYKDYLYKENGKWYKYGLIRKYTIDNDTELKAGTSSTDGYKRVGYGLPNEVVFVGNDKIGVYCNKFKSVPQNDNTPSLTGQHWFVSNASPTNFRILFRSGDLSLSDDDFITLLKTNNIILYFIRKTASITEIPKDITLYNQLEELNKYIGKGGTLVIETESEEENAQLIVKASALASFENS